MDDRDTAATGWLTRLRSHFGGNDNDDSEPSEKPFWKRYSVLFQLFAVAAAFGGIITSTASTVIDRITSFVRASGPELLDTLLPILVGVTLIAVVVCLVVIALGVRNV